MTSTEDLAAGVRERLFRELEVAAERARHDGGAQSLEDAQHIDSMVSVAARLGSKT